MFRSWFEAQEIPCVNKKNSKTLSLAGDKIDNFIVWSLFFNNTRPFFETFNLMGGSEARLGKSEQNAPVNITQQNTRILRSLLSLQMVVKFGWCKWTGHVSFCKPSHSSRTAELFSMEIPPFISRPFRSIVSPRNILARLHKCRSKTQGPLRRRNRFSKIFNRQTMFGRDISAECSLNMTFYGRANSSISSTRRCGSWSLSHHD